jgi:hypothetical protein
LLVSEVMAVSMVLMLMADLMSVMAEELEELVPALLLPLTLLVVVELVVILVPVVMVELSMLLDRPVQVAAAVAVALVDHLITPAVAAA